MPVARCALSFIWKRYEVVCRAHRSTRRGPRPFPAEGLYRPVVKETAESDLRSSACLTVPEGTEGEGDIETMTIPGGLFAVAHVEIDAGEFGEAWDKLVGEWMPENGCEPDEGRLCYELYLNDHEQHPEKKFIVDICEPVKRG